MTEDRRIVMEHTAVPVVVDTPILHIEPAEKPPATEKPEPQQAQEVTVTTTVKPPEQPPEKEQEKD